MAQHPGGERVHNNYDVRLVDEQSRTLRCCAPHRRALWRDLSRDVVMHPPQKQLFPLGDRGALPADDHRLRYHTATLDDGTGLRAHLRPVAAWTDVRRR